MPWEVWTSPHGREQLLAASVANMIGSLAGGSLVFPTVWENTPEWCNGDPFKTGRLGYILGVSIPGMIANVYVGTVRWGIVGDWGLSQMFGVGGATLGLSLLCTYLYPWIQSPLLKVALTVLLPSITAAAGNVYGFNFHREIDQYWQAQRDTRDQR